MKHRELILRILGAQRAHGRGGGDDDDRPARSPKRKPEIDAFLSYETGLGLAWPVQADENGQCGACHGIVDKRFFCVACHRQKPFKMEGPGLTHIIDEVHLRFADYTQHDPKAVEVARTLAAYRAKRRGVEPGKPVDPSPEFKTLLFVAWTFLTHRAKAA